MWSTFGCSLEVGNVFMDIVRIWGIMMESCYSHNFTDIDLILVIVRA